jgi:hypothetical protein
MRLDPRTAYTLHAILLENRRVESIRGYDPKCLETFVTDSGGPPAMIQVRRPVLGGVGSAARRRRPSQLRAPLRLPAYRPSALKTAGNSARARALVLGPRGPPSRRTPISSFGRASALVAERVRESPRRAGQKLGERPRARPAAVGTSRTRPRARGGAVDRLARRARSPGSGQSASARPSVRTHAHSGRVRRRRLARGSCRDVLSAGLRSTAARPRGSRAASTIDPSWAKRI